MNVYKFYVIAAVSKDGETVIHNDMTYSLRHVEESWIHLLKAGKTRGLYSANEKGNRRRQCSNWKGEGAARISNTLTI